MGAIRPRALHPFAERRLCQIEVTGDTAHPLALVEHAPASLGLEVVIKSPACPALGRVCHRSGHRSRLSEDVHETGSSPGVCRRLPAPRLEAGRYGWRQTAGTYRPVPAL